MYKETVFDILHSERILFGIDTYASRHVPLNRWSRTFQIECKREGQNETTMPLTQVARNHAQRDRA